MPRNRKFESFANKLMDAYFHPKIRKERNKKFYYIVLDYYLHKLVEQNPEKK